MIGLRACRREENAAGTSNDSPAEEYRESLEPLASLIADQQRKRTAAEARPLARRTPFRDAIPRRTTALGVSARVRLASVLEKITGKSLSDNSNLN
jgi:hypothetical protein